MSREGELLASAVRELESALETLEEHQLEELQPAYLRGGKDGDVVAKENIKALKGIITGVGEGLNDLLALYKWVEPDNQAATGSLDGLEKIKEVLNDPK